MSLGSEQPSHKLEYLGDPLASLFQTESLTTKNGDILAQYAAHDYKLNGKKIRINECKMPGRRFF